VDAVGQGIDILTLDRKPSIFEFCCNQGNLDIKNTNSIPDGIGMATDSGSQCKAQSSVSNSFSQY
jgi:hypothetical protein